MNRKTIGFGMPVGKDFWTGIFCIWQPQPFVAILSFLPK